MKTTKQIALGVLVLVVVLAVYVCLAARDIVSVLIPNSYAAWTTGNLIVEYLGTHDDRWPTGWGDLREARATLEGQGKPIYWDFDRLPEMIAVDWTTDVHLLLGAIDRTDAVPFRVVTKLDGSPVDHRWGDDTEPNQRIYQYLRGKKEIERRTQQPAGTDPAQSGAAQP